MNITPQVPNLSIPTVLNPHTESLRRENNQREMITQPAATSQSTAEKGVASDRERSRTPSQNNADIDFASITEQAELANSSITEQDDKHNGQHDQANDQSAEAQNSSQEETDGSKELSPEQEIAQEQVITQLEQRDQEVRTHEMAHAAVGGSHAGSPSYSYEQGPDGKKYVVDGEVSIDVAAISGDPQATITKMQQVHAAALAPANPSTQDRNVASIATQKILVAQSELLSELGNQVDETEKDSEDNQSTSTIDTSSKGSQSEATVQRSLRVESFYSDITQAYEKSPSFNFELTA
jgi:hypothetical protein